MNLSLDDAMELGQLLQFLDEWLATDRGTVSESLTRFVGCDAYGVQSLHHDIARFTFLLGEGLFSPRTPDWLGALLRPSWWVPNAIALVRTGPSWAAEAWLPVLRQSGACALEVAANVAVSHLIWRGAGRRTATGG